MSEDSPPPYTPRRGFVDLARELRDEIWKLALSPNNDEDKDSAIVWIDRRRRNDRFTYRPPAPLNAVCRLFRQDVMDTYFSHHHFRYQRADIAIAWLRTLPFDSRTKVTALYCCPCPFGIDEWDKSIERACSQWSLQCKMFRARGIDVKEMLHVCNGVHGEAVEGWFEPEELQIRAPIEEEKKRMRMVEAERRKKEEEFKGSEEGRVMFEMELKHYVKMGWDEPEFLEGLIREKMKLRDE